MRTLLPPIDTVIDRATRKPRVGSYRGPLPQVDLRPLGRGPLFRLARNKRWIWGAIGTDELLLGFAAIDTGYAASAFGWAYSRTARRMLADRSAVAPGFCVQVGAAAEEGCAARFGCGRDRVAIERPAGSSTYAAALSLGDLAIDARLDAAGAPTPLSAIVELPPDGVATTQKRVLLQASGTATIGGRTFRLDGGTGGLDYSHGYPPRHTTWKWCFAMGRARSGEPIAFNLVEGFVGEPECAVWIGDDVQPVGEGRFAFDRGNPLAPWSVRTTDGAVELTFAPGGVHREEKNLGLIASHFVQVAGEFRGSLALPGRAPLELDGVVGVTEDQDVRW